jgi:hypothetical protein
MRQIQGFYENKKAALVRSSRRTLKERIWLCQTVSGEAKTVWQQTPKERLGLVTEPENTKCSEKTHTAGTGHNSTASSNERLSNAQSGIPEETDNRQRGSGSGSTTGPARDVLQSADQVIQTIHFISPPLNFSKEQI